MKICGVILAAGEGSRLKSSRPKHLQKICGWPLLVHSIKNLRSAGIQELSVVLGDKISQEESLLLDKVKVVHQKDKLGTADAFLKAVEALYPRYRNFLLLYVDVPLIRPQTLKRLQLWHLKQGASLTFLSMKLEDPRGYGRIIRDESGKVVEIKEEDLLQKEEKYIQEVNVGVYLFKGSEILLQGLRRIAPKGKKREKYLTQIIPYYYRKNLKVASFLLDDSKEGLGINTPEQLAQANRLLFLRNATYHLKRGVSIIAPENTYIEMGVEIGRDTVIYPFVYIESGTKIGKNCSIGPSSRIRSGTFIADNVSIGNFVEIVRSRIDKGTRIRHFSYIGDALVGRDVNIGAGTVTANYDGRRKNLTLIGEGAFIGSNTTLIAPVKIGRYAITGAGSVVTKNKEVPPQTVVVGVPAKILRRRKDG